MMSGRHDPSTSLRRPPAPGNGTHMTAGPPRSTRAAISAPSSTGAAGRNWSDAALAFARTSSAVSTTWWTRQGGGALIDHVRAQRFQALVAHARRCSPLYAKLYAALPAAPLVHGVPIMTRQTLMQHFDEGMTDRTVQRAGIERFLRDPANIGKPYLGRYVVWTSSGTSGERGVYVTDVAALAVYDVDELGLDRLDRAVLTALTKSFGGGPVGVSTLAVAVGEEATTVEEVCEPFLVRAGMIARTPRGRVATPLAWTHLGMVPPPRASGLGQSGLFE